MLRRKRTRDTPPAKVGQEIKWTADHNNSELLASKESK
jgi:hypothetical protein